MSFIHSPNTPALRGKVSMSSRSLLFVAAVALTVSLAACGRGDAAEDVSAEPVTIAVGPEGIAVATRSLLSVGPQLSGTLVAERTARIRAEVPGAVLSVNVDPARAWSRNLARQDRRPRHPGRLPRRAQWLHRGADGGRPHRP